jgi:hypothetical protein
LHIAAEITGQHGRKVYTSAVGRLNSSEGEIAVRAAALFIIVPMEHFINNAPDGYFEELAKTPELLTFVDPNFEINP